MTERTAVVTVTFYDLNKTDMLIRSELALGLMAEALERNCAVYSVDGGSTDAFVERARSLGAVMIPQEGKGISGGQQQAIAYARKAHSPTEYILIEPEKRGLLNYFFNPITAPLREGLADLVVVGRTQKSMLTLPPMQRHTESAVNEMWKTLSGLDQDLLFAPRVFNPRMAEMFLDYQPTRNWDLFQGPMMDAMAAGLGVVPVKLDYSYPEEMVGHEIGNLTFDKKRIKQLQELTEFLEQYSRFKGIAKS